MAEIRSVVVCVILLTIKSIKSFEALNEENSNFVCSSGEEIQYVEECDGNADCQDESDEKACGTVGILFYYTYENRIPIVSDDCQRYIYGDSDYYYNYYHCSQYFGYEQIILNGLYMNNNKEFSLTAVSKTIPAVFHVSWNDEFFPAESIQIISNGPQLDIFYAPNRKNYGNLSRATGSRNGSLHSLKMDTQENFKNPVVDWVTSHVYCISNTRIKVCDKNFVICIPLPSKFITNPFLLTFSSEYRSLFFVEQTSSQYFLYKYPLGKKSNITRIAQGLNAPTWLTIDSIHKRVYWMDRNNSGTIFINSTSFEGTHSEEIFPGTPINDIDTTFAVFDDAVYWPDINQKKILKCSVGDCDQPTSFKDITSFSTETSHINTNRIGNLFVEHRTTLPDEVDHPCKVSPCSHLCLLELGSEVINGCYCEGSQKPLSASMSNGYCEDSTLIATYKNYVYVVGLYRNPALAPIIQKNRLNLTSISSVTYNSIAGSVILTETGVQNIYSWTPRTRKLDIILQGGPGTIKEIEFDDYANNLYWIDPTRFVVKVMNLRTLVKMDILERNSTYTPIKFTLLPAAGIMAVLFLKNNSTITIERLSMDGGRYLRKPPYEDPEANDIEHLSIHYMRKTRVLYLLDRQTNKIRYFSEKESEFQDLQNLALLGNVEQISSLNNYIVWSEEDLVIRRVAVDESPPTSLVQNISLKLNDSDNNDLRIAAVTKSVKGPRLAKCLQNNGGCEKLCLMSNRYAKFTCLCDKNEEVVDGTSCRKIPDQKTSSKSKSSDVSVSGKDESTLSNHLTKTSLAQDRPISDEKFPAYSKSSPLESYSSDVSIKIPFAEERTTTYTKIPNTTQKSEAIYSNSSPLQRPIPQYVEQSSVLTNNCTCLICQNPESLEQSTKNSWSENYGEHIVFYVFFIATFCLGFLLGYLVFRRDLFTRCSTRLSFENGILELSRMKGESTNVLYSKEDNTGNEIRDEQKSCN